MCKLMMIPGIKPEFLDDTWKFIFEMAEQMSSPNSFERDGLGFAAVNSKGELQGERWLRNWAAFRDREEYGAEVNNKWLKEIKNITKEKVYSKFGRPSRDISAITMHSRTSTNTVHIKNTHPFVEGFTSIIHNGVITNDDKLTKKTSTCDSEVVLHEYIKYNIMNKPTKFQKVANKLEGSYALGILSKTSNGVIVMDVVKDASANLEWFIIKELGTIVYATPKFNTSPAEEACKKLGFTILKHGKVKDSTLQRYNAITGDPIVFQKFKPNERYSSAHERTYGNRYDQTNNSWDKTDKGETLADRYGKQDNVIELPAKKDKTENAPTNVMNQKVKDRMLEETLIMGITEEKKLSEERFNDNSSEWYKDARNVWHRKDA